MLNKINDLNDGQSRAITAVQGPVLVIAGPGTGKTLTIVRRIAHLVTGRQAGERYWLLPLQTGRRGK